MTEIRLARPEDVDAIWALVQRAAAHMQSLGNPQWGEDYPTRAHYAADQARDELYVAECYANAGPILKRIMPLAKGSASRINKRTSHITVVLDTKAE